VPPRNLSYVLFMNMYETC